MNGSDLSMKLYELFQRPYQKIGRFEKELILLAEGVDFVGKEQREIVTNTLFDMAKQLCEQGEEEPSQELEVFPGIYGSFVWPAIRKYASMVHEKQAGELVYFLSEDRHYLTIQCALQATQNIFGAFPPTNEDRDSHLKILCERIDKLCDSFSCENFSKESTEQYAVAVNSVLADIILGNKDCLRKLKRIIDYRPLLPFQIKTLTNFGREQQGIAPKEKINRPGCRCTAEALDLLGEYL